MKQVRNFFVGMVCGMAGRGLCPNNMLNSLLIGIGMYIVLHIIMELANESDI